MKQKTPRKMVRKTQKTLAEAAAESYALSLFVTGTTPKSIRAIANLKQICETHLKGRYNLEVIDIYQQPGLAREQQLIAAPTLIKKLPLPVRKLIGDMTDTARVLVGLDVQSAPASAEAHGNRP